MSAFYEEFSLVLEILESPSGKLFLIRDFNIHWDNKLKPEQAQFEELLLEHEPEKMTPQ